MKKITRVFMIDTVPDNLDNFKHRQIEKGYLSYNPIKKIVKINNDVNLYFLVQSQDYIGNIEIPITEREYINFYYELKAKLINKSQYIVSINKNKYCNLDIYHGELNNLQLATVSFKSIKLANEFNIPNWFGKEITNHYTISDINLSKLSSKEIEQLFNGLTKKKY